MVNANSSKDPVIVGECDSDFPCRVSPQSRFEWWRSWRHDASQEEHPPRGESSADWNDVEFWMLSDVCHDELDKGAAVASIPYFVAIKELTYQGPGQAPQPREISNKWVYVFLGSTVLFEVFVTSQGEWIDQRGTMCKHGYVDPGGRVVLDPGDVGDENCYAFFLSPVQLAPKAKSYLTESQSTLAEATVRVECNRPGEVVGLCDPLEWTERVAEVAYQPRVKEWKEHWGKNPEKLKVASFVRSELERCGTGVGGWEDVDKPLLDKYLDEFKADENRIRTRMETAAAFLGHIVFSPAFCAVEMSSTNEEDDFDKAAAFDRLVEVYSTFLSDLDASAPGRGLLHALSKDTERFPNYFMAKYFVKEAKYGSKALLSVVSKLIVPYARAHSYRTDTIQRIFISLVAPTCGAEGALGQQLYAELDVETRHTSVHGLGGRTTAGFSGFEVEAQPGLRVWGEITDVRVTKETAWAKMARLAEKAKVPLGALTAVLAAASVALTIKKEHEERGSLSAEGWLRVMNNTTTVLEKITKVTGEKPGAGWVAKTGKVLGPVGTGLAAGAEAVAMYEEAEKGNLGALVGRTLSFSGAIVGCVLGFAASVAGAPVLLTAGVVTVVVLTLQVAGSTIAYVSTDLPPEEFCRYSAFGKRRNATEHQLFPWAIHEMPCELWKEAQNVDALLHSFKVEMEPLKALGLPGGFEVKIDGRGRDGLFDLRVDMLPRVGEPASIDLCLRPDGRPISGERHGAKWGRYVYENMTIKSGEVITVRLPVNPAFDQSPVPSDTKVEVRVSLTLPNNVRIPRREIRGDLYVGVRECALKASSLKPPAWTKQAKR
jgi:hypothetical protein